MLRIPGHRFTSALIAATLLTAFEAGCASPIVDPDTGPRPDNVQATCPDVPAIDMGVPDIGTLDTGIDAAIVSDALDITCADGEVTCGTTCTSLSSDNRHCGACANACPAGSPCESGRCQVNCQGGTLRCGEICIDPRTSRDYCGASGGCTGASAGTTCMSGQVCLAGVCRVVCPFPQINCEGICVDPATSAAHCGAAGDCTNGDAGAMNSAGTTCTAGNVCSGGRCASTCGVGQLNCGGTCTDPMTSQTNCGASGACAGATAGVACATGQFCIGGVCQVSCGMGLVNCGGTCVDPTRNQTHCGASGTCLGASAGAVCLAHETCLGGQCLFYEPPRSFSSPGVFGNGGTIALPFSSSSFYIDSPARGTIVYTLDGSTPNPGMAGTLTAPSPFRVNVDRPMTVRWYADYGPLGRELDYHSASLTVTDLATRNNHGVVVENVNINMSNRAVALVAPGSVVRVSAQLSYWHSNAMGYCPGCVSYAGVHVDATPGSPPTRLECVPTGPGWPGTQRAARNWMFTAPTVRGRYSIRLSLALAFDCGGPGSYEVGEVIVR